MAGAKSSPRKTVPTSAQSQLSPKETMKYLFDSSQPDMSAFRVLYNLEVGSDIKVVTIHVYPTEIVTFFVV